MAEHAIHPPIHLVTHTDEPIRSLEAAAKVIRRHAGDQRDRRAEHVLHQIKSAATLEEADAEGLTAGSWKARLGSSHGPPASGCIQPTLSHKAYLRSRIAAIALT